MRAQALMSNATVCAAFEELHSDARLRFASLKQVL